MARVDPAKGNYMAGVILPWARQHGPAFRLRGLWRPLVVVTDPATATWALSRGAGLEKSTELYHGINLMSSATGHPTLLSRATADPAWKAVRKAVAPAFAAGALKARFPAVQRAAADAVAAVAAAGGAPVDVDAVFAAEACAVVSRLGFGIDPAVAPDALAHLHAATAAAEQYIVSPARATWVARALGVNRALEATMAAHRANVDAVLAAAAAAAAHDDSAGDDESLYRRLVAAVGGGDPDALRREAGLLYFAAVDTSSHTAAYTLMFLAAHPPCAARAAAELDAAGLLASPARPRPAVAAPADVAAARLPYLAACIKESMRLMPVAAGGTGRIVGAGGARVAGGYVPPGVELWVPFFALHRSVAAWGDDADAFRPERWLDAADPAGPEHARRFMPFSAGARSCVGQALAELNVAVGVASLLGRFSFAFPAKGSGLPSSLEEAVAATGMAITLQPTRGLWLVATDRAGPAARES